MKLLLIEQEKMDGKIYSILSLGKKNLFFLCDRMTINEFKLAYPQINPNINIYTIDADAERRNFFFLSLFFFLWSLMIIHRGFHDVRYGS